MTTIPIINMEFGELKELIWTKLQEPRAQRKLVLVIVSIALLLDNMLYMVIVPIIPDYLRYIGAYPDEPLPTPSADNTTVPPGTFVKHQHHGQDSATGILFASKAIVQLMVNPFSGALIDRIGYDLPMMIGLSIMFLSTAVFACGRSYGLLFFARSLQGVGSAFADTAGLAMIADRFTEENERSKALGIALAFISFGCLVAPPFGGALYQFAGKEVPFLILAFVSLADGFMLLFVMKPLKEQIKDSQRDKPPGIPIWRLFIDPYIAVCSGALMMSNVALAFLEPTISLWMEDNLTTDNWKIGMIWLPAFFPHVFGVILTVKMARRYPHYQWIMAAGGLALEGLCCFIIPFSSSYVVLMIPICGICFGIALIDTALLPTLGYLVDVRYVSVYGSIYAIADISYSVAYAIGPIIAGGVVEAIGFTALNIGIAFSNLLYAPVLIYLRHIYDFKPFENEANILMSDPPDKEYQTYTLQDQKPVNAEVKNHLEYSQYQENLGMQETNIDSVEQNGYGNQYQGYQNQGAYQNQQNYQNENAYQEGYQVQDGYQQQNMYGRGQGQRMLPAQPAGQAQDANPFRRPDVPAPAPAPASNQNYQNENAYQEGYQVEDGYQQQNMYGRGGWKESILSFPKKWLSGANIAYSKDTSSGDHDSEVVLPKLPVPNLEHTMERYLSTMQPLLTEVQHERLRHIIDRFAGPTGLGPKLQLYLLDRQLKMDNWAYEYWLNDMYLGNPAPLPVNSNPGMVFPPRRFTTVLDVARFAARMLDAALDHKEILDRRALPIEKATSREKGQPLCMSQYYRLFTSCRLPGKPLDSIFTTPAATHFGQNTEHVIVACRNQLYCVPVKASDRGRLNEDELCAQLMHILDDAPCLASPPPMGILTASHRHHWAEAREALIYDERNRRNLDLIQRSMLIVCLDEPLPASFNCRQPRGGRGHTAGQRDETNMALQMIHGGGSSVNSANRWFDKTIQLIISNDGACGLCYEHSPAEGVAVIQLMEQLLRHVDGLPGSSTVPSISSSHLPPPERLEWRLDANNYKHLQEAAQNLDKLIEDLDFQVFRYTGFGKDFIKSCSVSPDVFIQLALQLAYYRMYGRLTATYESASTRRFRLGRVDCIRSASSQALDWATVMCQAEPAGLPEADGDASDDELLNTAKKDQQKYELFEAAVKKQTETMVENILGEGIDIHLLGLREAARETSPTAVHPLPEIFTDESYRIANAFLLSTSQVATSGDCFMGYGPVVPDGYGASYNPRKDSIIFCISAFRTSDRTSVSKFTQALEESLNSMYGLLGRIKVK